MALFCPHCAAGQPDPPASGVVRCRSCGKSFELWLPARQVEAEGQIVAESVSAAGATDLAGAEGTSPVAAVAEPQARCARHPNNVANKACARCGDYMCAVCATSIEGRSLCVKCFEHVDQAGELMGAQAAFRMPGYSLLLGIVSIPLGWINCIGLVIGPAAVVLGILSLRHIAARPALPGRQKAVTGIVCGALGFVVTIGVYVVLIYVAAHPGEASMTAPLYIRSDTPFSRARWSVWADKLQKEKTGLIGWDREALIHFDEIESLTRYYARIPGYLGCLVGVVPVVILGLIASMSNGIGGGIILGIAALLLTITLLIANRKRPFLRITVVGGQSYSLRMDRPLFRVGLRRNFFARVFQGAGLQPPALL